MPASAARIAANRANSLKSTGPRTEAGKAASRRNGLKHGMTGDGVVLTEADEGAVADRLAVLEGELKPGSEVGRILVRRMAVLSVRMERSVEQEGAAIAGRVRHAGADFDDRQAAEVDRLWDWITAEPSANARRLKQTPAGIDRMLREWAAIRADLTHPTQHLWSFTHVDKSENLTGRRMEDLPASRFKILSKAAWGDFSLLDDHEGAGLDDAARRDWAEDRLVELIDAEVAGLEALRATLDPDAFALDRAEAGLRALFDPSKEATLARKYEAAAERGFYRALREFREEAAREVEGGDSSDEPLASSFPEGSEEVDMVAGGGFAAARSGRIEGERGRSAVVAGVRAGPPVGFGG